MREISGRIGVLRHVTATIDVLELAGNVGRIALETPPVKDPPIPPEMPQPPPQPPPQPTKM